MKDHYGSWRLWWWQREPNMCIAHPQQLMHLAKTLKNLTFSRQPHTVRCLADHAPWARCREEHWILGLDAKPLSPTWCLLHILSSQTGNLKASKAKAVGKCWTWCESSSGFGPVPFPKGDGLPKRCHPPAETEVVLSRRSCTPGLAALSVFVTH